MTRKILGGIEIDAFMRRNWQREPLLVRRAFAQFRDPLDIEQVLELARGDRVPSRLVRRRGAAWTLEHGPIPAARFKQLPRRDWTVLVQDTNHVSDAADRLLRTFDFIPHARIDDVMVSYAVPGGGVGPHVDSYDVFLLQGRGRRRWQISRQRDHAFMPGLPLRVLEHFVPEEEWVLEAGDMLYLPPGVAHHGVAETECLTWSIGFRAPSDEDLMNGFLDALRDRPKPEGHYADPGADAARHAGEIPAAMISHAARVLAGIRWDEADVASFTGRLLSEPKGHVFFEPPRRALSREAFVAQARRRGLALDPRARLLFSGTMFFMNGEAIAAPPAARAPLRMLADARALDAPGASDAFWDLAHVWYRQGFVVLRGRRP